MALAETILKKMLEQQPVSNEELAVLLSLSKMAYYAVIGTNIYNRGLCLMSL